MIGRKASKASIASACNETLAAKKNPGETVNDGRPLKKISLRRGWWAAGNNKRTTHRRVERWVVPASWRFAVRFTAEQKLCATEKPTTSHQLSGDSPPDLCDVTVRRIITQRDACRGRWRCLRVGEQQCDSLPNKSFVRQKRALQHPTGSKATTHQTVEIRDTTIIINQPTPLCVHFRARGFDRMNPHCCRTNPLHDKKENPS